MSISKFGATVLNINKLASVTNLALQKLIAVHLRYRFY
jgi:hypothetical protein